MLDIPNAHPSLDWYFRVSFISIGLAVTCGMGTGCTKMAHTFSAIHLLFKGYMSRYMDSMLMILVLLELLFSIC